MFTVNETETVTKVIFEVEPSYQPDFGHEPGWTPGQRAIISLISVSFSDHPDLDPQASFGGYQATQKGVRRSGGGWHTFYGNHEERAWAIKKAQEVLEASS